MQHCFENNELTMIASNQLVGDSKGLEIVGCHLVTLGSSGEELRTDVWTDSFRLSEVSQAHEADIAGMSVLGPFKDGFEVISTRVVVLQVARIHVEVSQHTHCELVRRHSQ